VIDRSFKFEARFASHAVSNTFPFRRLSKLWMQIKPDIDGFRLNQIVHPLTTILHLADRDDQRGISAGGNGSLFDLCRATNYSMKSKLRNPTQKAKIYA